MIEELIKYDERSDRFFTVDVSGPDLVLGYFKHYTVDDLIRKAKDLLAGKEMTQEEKQQAHAMLSERLTEQHKQVTDIEPRLVAYFDDLTENPDNHNAYEMALLLGKGSGHGIWFIIGFLYNVVNLLYGFCRNLVVIAVNDI